MTHRTTVIVLAGVALALVAASGCSDSGEERLPCPPRGIGVEEVDGVTPAGQVEQYRRYDCAQPQICPDEGVLSPAGGKVPYFGIVPNCRAEGTCPPPAPINLNLTNCSTGTEKLIIEKVVILGDERCHFEEALIESDPSNPTAPFREVAPGETITIKTDWNPTVPGEDHGAFQIFSNAQNFAPLKVAFCSEAFIVTDPVEPDAGVLTDASVLDATADSATVLPDFECRDVTTVTSDCHSENP